MARVEQHTVRMAGAMQQKGVAEEVEVEVEVEVEIEVHTDKGKGTENKMERGEGEDRRQVDGRGCAEAISLRCVGDV